MTTKKLRDYKNGEIHRTPNGNYVFIEGNKHAGEYPSVAVLIRAVDGRQVPEAQKTEQSHNIEPSDTDKPSKKPTKPTTTKAKKQNRKG